MSIALANTAQITTRYVRAFLRQPYYIVGTLVQPVIWLLLSASSSSVPQSCPASPLARTFLSSRRASSSCQRCSPRDGVAQVMSLTWSAV